MLRHVIAPARSFAQIPHAILRHPRLSSDAKNLLAWQLSLPPGEKQCLSDTARRAGIKKCAFQRAKRQLLDEGYVHQWTVQREGGRFATVQLVSNTVLSAAEALAARDGLRPAPGATRLTAAADSGGARPSAAEPTAGEPTCRPVGRQPEEDTGENTTRPTGPAHPPEDGPPPDEPAVDGGEGVDEATSRPGSGGLPDAEMLLLSLRRVDPQLAMPVRTARNWAPLAAKWLDSGLSPLRIRHTLTEGLDSARRPLGALRWRLEHALPQAPPPPPSVPQAPAPVRTPRVPRMRECRTRHTQPRLFTPLPGSDEEHCPDCRARAAREAAPAPPVESSGYAAFVAARRGKHS
ncbi:hypothetical protein [Streptomyces sp. TR06-5]|uniref:hypothetical protein n=1 Tax=unclassified Streptomyces TaxID=2593676 RepID=UPI0039A016C4